jgi:hypothetical protein
MPLKVNVGLSRKVGEANYGSRGASVNVEMELDAGLIGEPAKLQERIRQLFGVVRASLAEELNGNGQAHASSNHPASGGPPSNGSGNGHGNAGLSKDTRRPVTQSQLKAIHAIAKLRHVDLKKVLRDQFGLARAEDMDIREASTLIDTLKASATREGG